MIHLFSNRYFYCFIEHFTDENTYYVYAGTTHDKSLAVKMHGGGEREGGLSKWFQYKSVAR